LKQHGAKISDPIAQVLTNSQQKEEVRKENDRGSSHFHAII